MAWIVLVVVIMRAWYCYIVLNGSLFESICSEEELDQTTLLGTYPSIPIEECNNADKRLVYADLTIGWIFDIYFATAIRRWSQSDEGYQAVN